MGQSCEGRGTPSKTAAHREAVTADEGRRLLKRAERAWRNRDLDALLDLLDPEVRIVVNAQPPVEGIAAAHQWLAERLRTQVNYRPVKRFRGAFDSTVVCRWTGAWQEPDGQALRCVGIELLALGDDGRITSWEAVTLTEPAAAQEDR